MKNRNPLFVLALVVLAVTGVAPFLLRGIWGWSTGLVYIGYDTFLLTFVGITIASILSRGERSAAASARVSLAVLVPSRNEGPPLLQTIDALLAQSDRPDEILVVDDGSTDDTRSRLTDRYHLSTDGRSARERGLRVVFKAHSGKADSMNLAWRELRSEIVVTLDADTIVERDAVEEIRRAFSANPRLAAAGGTLVPTCAGRGVLALALQTFQRFEYVRAFLSRRAWMEKNALLLVSGAFAAYRRETVARLGGFDVKSLVEDYEIIHRIHRAGAGEVQVLAKARAYTDSPDTILAFLRQRRRWFAGFLQTQFRNADMIGNPRYGNVGTLMLPIKSLDTLQPIFGIVAFVFLVLFLFGRYAVGAMVLRVIAAKIGIDLFFHFWSLALYARWQNRPHPARTWLIAFLITLVEPFTFQLLRHAGACWGWQLAFSRQNDWTPVAAANSDTEVALRASSTDA